MNILLSGNRKYLKGILLNIMSITKYHKGRIDFYIITMNLQNLNKDYEEIKEEDRVFLEKHVKKINNNSNVKLYNITELYNKNYGDLDVKRYTPYCLCRLSIQQIEDFRKLDKLIYLDVDTMLARDIKELWDIEVNSYEIAAVKDIGLKKYFFINNFNSGVLLINIKESFKNNLFENTIKLLKKRRFILMDQSALNKIAKKVLYIDYKFNTQWDFEKEITVIKHFCRRVHIFPFFKIKNIKQWEFDKVNKELKITYFDDIFKEYNKIKNEYPYLKKL